jgi:hypothetical protein
MIHCFRITNLGYQFDAILGMVGYQSINASLHKSHLQGFKRNNNLHVIFETGAQPNKLKAAYALYEIVERSETRMSSILRKGRTPYPKRRV